MIFDPDFDTLLKESQIFRQNNFYKCLISSSSPLVTFFFKLKNPRMSRKYLDTISALANWGLILLFEKMSQEFFALTDIYFTNQ